METTLLQQHRANKDDFFVTSHQSPLPPGARSDFSGLRYFAPNPDLDLHPTVKPGHGDRIRVQTSDGAERRYEIAGTVAFLVAGEMQELTLYDTGHGGYFVPFRDATSGRQTYGAGRYLDLQPNSDGTVDLNFNLAYNPFCAYDDAFSCPLPPASNWLEVPIEAGELDFKH